MSDDMPQALRDGSNPDVLRSVTDSDGRTWEQFSPTQLVGLISFHGGERVRNGAAAELNRRLAVANAMFADQSREQTEALIQATRAAAAETSTLVALTKAAGRQADTMVNLTWAIAILTVVLGIIAGLQLKAMYTAQMPTVIVVPQPQGKS